MIDRHLLERIVFYGLTEAEQHGMWCSVCGESTILENLRFLIAAERHPDKVRVEKYLRLCESCFDGAIDLIQQYTKRKSQQRELKRENDITKHQEQGVGYGARVIRSRREKQTVNRKNARR